MTFRGKFWSNCPKFPLTFLCFLMLRLICNFRTFFSLLFRVLNKSMISLWYYSIPSNLIETTVRIYSSSFAFPALNIFAIIPFFSGALLFLNNHNICNSIQFSAVSKLVSFIRCIVCSSSASWKYSAHFQAFFYAFHQFPVFVFTEDNLSLLIFSFLVSYSLVEFSRLFLISTHFSYCFRIIYNICKLSALFIALSVRCGIVLYLFCISPCLTSLACIHHRTTSLIVFFPSINTSVPFMITSSTFLQFSSTFSTG